MVMLVDESVDLDLDCRLKDAVWEPITRFRR